jgi:oxygen-independent coproporphyrinogen-3 oxidase
MAGIYIHIPFCSKKCGYCDFYSIIRLSQKDDFVNALLKEIYQRQGELLSEKVETIYLGGGTPSLLKISDLKKIIFALEQSFDLSEVKEKTIEVNPDDINENYIKGLIDVGFNRLSIGIQSFNNCILTFMNRRHDANQAIEAVELAKKAGFKNTSIDLIYGIPKMDSDTWKNSLKQAIDLNVQHISAYHLTFEPGTHFYTKLKRGEISEIHDDDSVHQYTMLVKELKKAGFEDYEISNFCKPGCKSNHNYNYWTGKSYLGMGPSAHSFKENVRRWNVSDVNEYIDAVNWGSIYFEKEELSAKEIYNECIMLGLRTRDGVDITKIRNSFNSSIVDFFNQEMKKNIDHKNVIEKNGFLTISEGKKFLTDKIITDFFMI